MLASLSVRLPGVYFETASPRPAEDLPRMDVAAFVGFAASGPLHTPVEVEDLGRFRDIFGGELTLAWDEERGEPARAWLPSAVAAFFRNGGRRCWVVRVADEAAARTLRFPIPGLTGASGEPADALARSPGAWASELRLGAVLGRERFALATGAAAGFASGRWRLSLAQSPRTLDPGDLLEVLFEDDGLALLLFVDGAEAVDGELAVWGERAQWRRPTGSLGAENPNIEAVTEAEAEALAAGSPGLQPTAAHRLTFDLLAWRGSRLERRIEGLAFHADHPRWWGALPGDDELFRVAAGRAHEARSLERELLRAEAALPRFPFAGPADAPRWSLPLGMPLRPEAELASAGDLPAGLSRLEIDGLAEFDDRLFLDPVLARSFTGSLAADAEHRHSLEFFQAGARLRGLHALWPASEVSLIAVPDAAQRGWTRLPPPSAEPLGAPVLDPVGALDEHGRALLVWTSVDGATGYRLEFDRCRNFSRPARIETGAPAAGPSNEAYFVPPEDCPAVYFFRVRAERRGEIGPWSNSRAALLPPEQFGVCGAPRPEVADLILTETAAGSPDEGAGLAWDPEDPLEFRPDDSYELQVSGEPGFEAPERIAADAPGFDAAARTYFPGPLRDAPRYYRVRAVRDGKKGVWSNAVRLAASARAEWTLLPEAEYSPDTLVAVQRSLIRFCAARADATAILSLPRGFREDDATRHLGDLLPRIDPRRSPERAVAGALRVAALSQGEADALSYAAVYHPWVAVAEAPPEGEPDGRMRVVWQPPDGPAAGLIAARTLASGAWIAPANDPIAAAIALDPAFDRASWARLTASQFNLAVEDTRGFLFSNAETLSRRDDLRPLGVRRLMILLRRLALREGAAFVFEPNGDDFRGLARQRFERFLSGLYVRGAFAGDTPAAGFRVVVDDSVNPPRAVETGRFVIELRVAPSRPFRYLTVRLEQASPEKLTAEEV